MPELGHFMFELLSSLSNNAIMKNLTSLLLLVLAILSCQNNSTKKMSDSENVMADSLFILATQSESKLTLSADSNLIFSDLNKYLWHKTEIGPNTIHSFQLYQNPDNQKAFLIFYGSMAESQNWKASIALQQKNNCLYIEKELLMCISINCVDENTACLPIDGACSPCGNSNKCLKIVSTNPKIIFPSLSKSICVSN